MTVKTESNHCSSLYNLMYYVSVGVSSSFIGSTRKSPRKSSLYNLYQWFGLFFKMAASFKLTICKKGALLAISSLSSTFHYRTRTLE